MTGVHVVVPNDIDDPTRPSGGNLYDRRICRGLAAFGWSVREHAVRGAWPRPVPAERASLARLLATLPHDAVVLLDGLVASAVPDVLVAQARRLRMVVLMHMPLGDAAMDLRYQERQALSAAVAVVTTSFWSRQRLLDLYALPTDRVHAAPPGVDAAPLVPGSATGSHLLCVAAVTPHKGHDVLVRVLAAAPPDVSWSCTCVGALDRDPDFVDRLRRQVRAYGIADRVGFVGPCTGPDLDARYAAADLLVLASRGETYGMVVTEALARGIPVLATAANGLREAVGRAPDGSLPGLLVRPDDAAGLAGALRCWLMEPELRGQLRRSARGRRTTLTGWSTTSRLVSGAISRVSTNLSAGPMSDRIDAA
jgi:glycosyltransferase involved in cell wall biosynthesis